MDRSTVIGVLLIAMVLVYGVPLVMHLRMENENARQRQEQVALWDSLDVDKGYVCAVVKVGDGGPQVDALTNDTIWKKLYCPYCGRRCPR